jgi:hypothetical protein
VLRNETSLQEHKYEGMKKRNENVPMQMELDVVVEESQVAAECQDKEPHITRYPKRRRLWLRSKYIVKETERKKTQNNN